MSEAKVLFCGSGWVEVIGVIARHLPAGARLVSWDREAPLAVAAADADVILPSNGPCDAGVLDAAARAILIQQPAVGTDSIDLEAAKRRGIPVCNAPATNGASVAEAAVLLLLSVARRAKQCRRTFDQSRIGAPVGTELEGKTLLVLGAGQSGQRVARAATGLGMRVISARSTTPRRDLLAGLAEADAVSVHCPLTPATRGLFDDEAFSAMKPGAFLVNAARGPILDRGALERALDRGHLGGVGLDVFWAEPWDAQDPLYTRDDVFTLPHIAGSTWEAYERIATIVGENVRRALRGEPLLHRVA